MHQSILIDKLKEVGSFQGELILQVEILLLRALLLVMKKGNAMLANSPEPKVTSHLWFLPKKKLETKSVLILRVRDLCQRI
jgi:hypothetical protein